MYVDATSSEQPFHSTSTDSNIGSPSRTPLKDYYEEAESYWTGFSMLWRSTRPRLIHRIGPGTARFRARFEGL